MSNKCSAIYPVSGLTVNITITNNTTNVVDFSGVATEAGNTGVYNFIYTPDANTDYTWVATTPGYSDVKGVNFADGTSTGGISVGDIWNAQIEDFSDIPGSFGSKFANYGGVSHVINNNFNDEVKEELKSLILSTLKETKHEVIINKENEDFPINEIVELVRMGIPTKEELAKELADELHNREKRKKEEEQLKRDIDKRFDEFMRTLHKELTNKK